MKYLLVDEKISRGCKESLRAIGIETVPIPPLSSLPPAVASHTDMLFFPFDGKLYAPRTYKDEHPDFFAELSLLLPNLPLSFTDDRPGGKYPEDAPMNGLLIGRTLVCNSTSISPTLKEAAINAGYGTVHTRQGYSACSVLPLPPGAAITADRGIGDALESFGISVILISQSRSISLPPYEYGFIGGCAFRDGMDLYFFGNLDSHENCDIIKKVAFQYGYSITSLDPEADCLFDLGGAYLYEDGINDHRKNGHDQ